MATYINGLTDYIPQIQPFKPDFNFYNNVLGRKQQQYDAGWQQVNTMYNSILNAPMLRDSNNERREQFFTQAEQEIQRLSGVDLSLQQNVDAANSIFKPFYEDDNIINDISWTKRYQNELSMAESFRTCQDEKKCGGKYWDGGVRALNYKANEFRGMSDQEALGFRAPTYTPYKNIMKMTTEAAKEAGLSIKYDSKQGGYMVTTKNGQDLQIPLMNYFSQLFGDDPEVQNFYRTKAYLLGKENPEGAQALFQQGMTPEEATPEVMEKENLRQNFEKEAEYITDKAEIETNRLDVLMKKKAILDKNITKKGINPDSPDGKAYIQLLEDIEAQKGMTTKVNDISERAAEIGVQNEEQGASNAQMEGVIAQGMLMKDLWSAAQVHSYKDYERTMKVDQYGLESMRQRNRIAISSIKHSQSLDKMDYQYVIKASLQRQKYLLDEGVIDPASLMGGAGTGMETEASIYGNFGVSTGAEGVQMPNVAYSGAGMVGPGKRQPPQLAPMAIKKGAEPTVSIPGKGEEVTDVELAAALAIGDDPVNAINKYQKKYRGFTQAWKETSTGAKQEVSGGYLRLALGIAGNGANQDDADAMQLELLAVGDALYNSMNKYDAQLKKYGDEGLISATSDPAVEAIAALDDKTRERLRNFPSNIKNSGSLNNDYYLSVANDWENIIKVTGGNNNFYDQLLEGDGVWVKHPETGHDVRRSDIAPQLDDEQTYLLQKKASDIVNAKYDASDKGQTYSGTELTQQEKNDLYMIEYLDEVGGFERKHGVGSKIPQVVAFNNKYSALRSNITILDESNRKAVGMFNTAGENSAASVSNIYNDASSTERVIADNIWQKGVGESYGRMSTKDEVYNSLMEQGVQATGVWWAGTRESLGDIGVEYTKTLTQGEDELGVGFSDMNALRMMVDSEYRGGTVGGTMPSVNQLSAELSIIERGGGISEFGPLTVSRTGEMYGGALDNIWENRKYLDITRTGDELRVEVKREYKDRYEGIGAGGYVFDLANAEVSDKYWEILYDRAEPAWNDIAEQFATKLQTYDSPFGGQELGGGQGSFAAPELSFQTSPLKKYEENYKQGMSLIKEIIDNPEAVEGTGNVEFLTQMYQDYTGGKKWSASSKSLPFAMFEVKPISGELGTSEIKVTVSPNYQNSLGYNKILKGEYTNPLAQSQTYIIKDSKSEVIQNSMPDMFSSLLNKEGDVYTEPSFKDEVGTFTYQNVGGGQIQVTMAAEIFNVETGKMEPYPHTPKAFSSRGTDWQMIHNSLLEDMSYLQQINQHNQAAYNQVMGYTDPQEFVNING